MREAYGFPEWPTRARHIKLILGAGLGDTLRRNFSVAGCKEWAECQGRREGGRTWPGCGATTWSKAGVIAREHGARTTWSKAGVIAREHGARTTWSKCLILRSTKNALQRSSFLPPVGSSCAAQSGRELARGGVVGGCAEGRRGSWACGSEARGVAPSRASPRGQCPERAARPTLTLTLTLTLT